MNLLPLLTPLKLLLLEPEPQIYQPKRLKLIKRSNKDGPLGLMALALSADKLKRGSLWPMI